MRRYVYLFLAMLGAIAAPAAAQMPSGVPNPAPEAKFPPLPPLAMYGEVLTFRAQVETAIAHARPRWTDADSLTALVDSLVVLWDRYGTYMDHAHGDFPNMSRGRPYWLITTDEAADTLTDRVAGPIRAYVQAHPEELLGPERAEWEMGAEQLGVPRTRIFGFQFVELARRASALRRQLETAHPGDPAVFRDADIRFLWDLIQFYQQLHASYYDKNSMRVAEEDWIVSRMIGRCKDPKWKIALSLTAVGVDTTNWDMMSDKFMHRVVVVDPACPETVDFIVGLPHYRLMEKELAGKTPAQRDSLLRRIRADAEERGARLLGTSPGKEKR